MIRRFFLMVYCALLHPLTSYAASSIGPESGLALPRFASLKASETHLRGGPGYEYPVEWKYHIKAYPIQIIDEYGLWRRIKDVDGVEGWVNKQMLSGKRTAVIIDPAAKLNRRPVADSPFIAQAQKGALVELISCDPKWCKVEGNHLSGWIIKPKIWGIEADEEIKSRSFFSR